MIRKRHLALGNKGLAVNSIQMLLLQLAPNAGFSKKGLYGRSCGRCGRSYGRCGRSLQMFLPCFILSLALLDVETIWKLVELQEEDAGRVSRG